MKTQLINLIGGIALLFGLVGASSANVIPVSGGYEVNYTINMDPGSSDGRKVQDTFIFEWDNSGNFSVDSAYTIAGLGLTTLTHTVEFAPTSALLIGYGLGIAGVGDEKDHLYTITNADFAESVYGTKWSVAFPGETPEARLGHNAMVGLLKKAALDDLDALTTLKYFVVTEGYRAAFDPAGSFRVIEWTIAGPPVGSSVPEPATLGLLGIGLVGLGFLRRKR